MTLILHLTTCAGSRVWRRKLRSVRTGKDIGVLVERGGKVVQNHNK